MRKLEISTGIWKPALAVLGALAGLALAPASAQAQVCADPAEVAEDLLVEYFDEFEDYFLLSEKTCDSMSKTFTKACNTAVKDAVKCARHESNSIPKAAKPACKEASKNPSGCIEDFKDEAEAREDTIDVRASVGYDRCDINANVFFNRCQFGG